MKLKFLVGLILTGVAYVAVLVLGIRAEEQGKAALPELERMFHSVAAPPGTGVRDYYSWRKWRSCRVGASYSTSAGWTDIRSFYNAELGRLGWTFWKEECPSGEPARHAVYYTEAALQQS